MLNTAIKIAKEAGNILLHHFGNISSIQTKSENIDLVTVADIESEKFIIKAIKDNFPSHDIISEEKGLDIKNSDYRWVIDPLDGTTNFVHNLPIFAISMSLQYKKETILGVVYNPAVNKCFTAQKGKGAFLNNKPIHPSSINTLSESLLVTGFPYTHNERFYKGFIHFKDLYSKTQGIRRLGAASLDFCFVAMGRFEGYWEFGLKPWDICAGDLIVKESGGITSDWNGSPMPFNGNRILATNQHIHNEIVSILSKNIF